MAESSWVDLVEKKATLIFDQIASMRSLARRNEVSLDGADRPYFDLLRQLYREEFRLRSSSTLRTLWRALKGIRFRRGARPRKSSPRQCRDSEIRFGLSPRR